MMSIRQRTASDSREKQESDAYHQCCYNHHHHRTVLVLLKRTRWRDTRSWPKFNWLFVLSLISLMLATSVSRAQAQDEHHQDNHEDHHDVITHNNQLQAINLRSTRSTAYHDIIARTDGDGPQFLEPIGNHTVAAGKDVQLSCKITNLGQFRPAWLRVEDKGILTIYNNVITRNYRISLTNNDDKEFVLNIKNVQPSDRGGYMCQINSVPMKYAIGFLDILTPPTFDNGQTSADVVVAEGGNVSLTCKANGYPNPAITWRREDNEMILLNGMQKMTPDVGAAKLEGPLFTLTSVTRLHMGAYLCIASNGVAPSASKRIVVDVQFSPVIWLPQTEMGASIGQDVTITCHIESNPVSEYQWMRQVLPATIGNDNESSGGGGRGLGVTSSTNRAGALSTDDLAILDIEEIVNSDRYKIVSKQTHPYKVQLKLTIRNVDRRDFTMYKCVAKNSLGTQSNSVRLYESSLSDAIRNQAVAEERKPPSSLAGHSSSGDSSGTSSNDEFGAPPSTGRAHTRSWSYRQSGSGADRDQAQSGSSSMPTNTSSQWILVCLCAVYMSLRLNL